MSERDCHLRRRDRLVWMRVFGPRPSALRATDVTATIRLVARPVHDPKAAASNSLRFYPMVLCAPQFREKTRSIVGFPASGWLGFFKIQEGPTSCTEI